MPPGTPAPTPAWRRPPSPVRWESGWVGRRSTRIAWRSGRPSVTGRSPTRLTCAPRCGCRGRCSCSRRCPPLASAPPAVAVGELLVGGERGPGLGSRCGGDLLPSTLPRLGEHEVADTDGGDD